MALKDSSQKRNREKQGINREKQGINREMAF
jgi:hypothetical protein